MNLKPLIALFGSLIATSSTAADYKMAVIDTGLREYYCQLSVELHNTDDQQLREISGYFYAYIGDERVGRSKGAWFLNVEPSARSLATFETPNAPCDRIERYEFVVGACRLTESFVDKALCANRIDFVAPLFLAVE